MNVALRRPMSLTEFLAWEERQEARFEFDGFAPVAMVGGTEAHSIIQSNLVTALTNALRGKPCRAHGSHLKILVAGRIRYPDAFVVCAPLQPDAKFRPDPVVIFEILSPSSSHTDLVLKPDEYHATPSVQRYVVIEQTQPGAVIYSRTEQAWEVQSRRPGDVIALPEIDVSLALAELYEGLDFPDLTEEE